MKTLASLKIFYVFVFTVLLFACDDDEQKPSPETYFTLQANAHPQSASESWILIHDLNGQPLTGKKITVGETLTFDSIAAPAEFSVTFVSLIESNTYSLATYHGIQKGDQWTLSYPPNIQVTTPMAQINLRVSDPQLGSALDANYSTGNGLSFNFAFSSPDYVTTVVPYENTKMLISVVDKNGLPKFKFLEQPPTSDLSYTLADFAPFDKNINITFPPTDFFFAYTMGQTDADYPVFYRGFMTNVRNSSSTNNSDNLTSTTLGYLNRFVRNYTFLISHYDSYWLEYRAFGAIPSGNVALVNNFNVEVTNKTFSGFTTTGSDFSWQTTTWKNPLGTSFPTNWFIMSNAIGAKNPVAFPQNFSKAHPSLKIQDFSYNETQFYKSSRTYDQYLDNIFRGEMLQSYEEFVKGTQ